MKYYQEDSTLKNFKDRRNGRLIEADCDLSIKFMVYFALSLMYLASRTWMLMH